jgi:hypothetical protein
LLGFDVENPVPAQTVLSFAPAAATPPFVLPAGSEFEGTDPEQNRVAFRTLRDTPVQAAKLQAVQVDDGSGSPVDRTHDFFDGFPIQPLGTHPAAGAALYLGFDALASGALALGLRIEGPVSDRAERRRIIEEAAGEVAACRPFTTRFQCTPLPPAPALSLPPHHSAAIVWEVFTNTGWAAVTPDDNTRSLTLSGLVVFNLPVNLATTTLHAGETALYYIRCRMIAGQFDAIPVLLDVIVNAAPAEQSVPVTESFVIKAGATVSGPAPSAGDLVQLTFTATAAGLIQSLTFGTGSGPQVRVLGYTAPSGASAGSLILDLELAGIGSGLPAQQINLTQPQVDAASISVYTLAGAVWQQWTARDDFDSSSRTDFHFVLDAVAGTVTFGSGERGQTPQANSLILVRYRTTRASTGNIAAHTVNRARTSAFNDWLLKPLPAPNPTNRAAADGGAEMETLDHALGRAVEVLHAHERLLDLATSLRTTTLDQIDGTVVRGLEAPWRGVNLLDLERLALSVPGTRVARAHGWASLDADYPCMVAPGVATIVIVPEYPVDMPVPSPGLLDRVWRYLNRRRLVATTLKVTGPIYTQVTITASVSIRAGASPASVTARIQSALKAFLDPLHGGPASRGWPFGRSVYRAEILQLIQDVPGVDYVGSLSMQSDSGGPQCGDIPLCPAALTYSGTHTIEVI